MVAVAYAILFNGFNIKHIPKDLTKILGNNKYTQVGLHENFPGIVGLDRRNHQKNCYGFVTDSENKKFLLVTEELPQNIIDEAKMWGYVLDNSEKEATNL